MKHLSPLTKRTPAKAAGYQDLLCAIAQIISSFITLTGGTIPGLDYIATKCNNIQNPTT